MQRNSIEIGTHPWYDIYSKKYIQRCGTGYEVEMEKGGEAIPDVLPGIPWMYWMSPRGTGKRFSRLSDKSVFWA